ncbi:adenine phosphoribosyltransferase [Arthrobacter zhangbolii]|uniref:Adenine phosphoribosyltransferase n=1 Tax=Arthrobacter zhangbolii TaxID=2886936 RepID=A0A9X1S906_9MICC|nr:MULTISPECIES: adenine phosphoribosyltransferase [Arthrobacter]MCC3273190.1 adenine phosphoribosyltransferase [Arthrobacter zhangbolii]MDN3905040.1 adenine phosphoribosyltransferase [Arthrobacter sp. YD2]UON93222.1 adenine phosphoribosyltransferase [Arthrobacter zhangbolii]
MKDAPAEPVNNETIAQTIDRLGAVIPDYPQPGVVFRDLTPVFADGPALRGVVDALTAPFEGRFDYVVGVEARGFLLAAAAAYASGKGVITVRKPGKLPREVFAENYSLEYGEGTLELHRDDMPAGSRVLILDDVLATGGTLAAAARLLRKAGAEVAGFGVVLELGELGGRERLGDTPVEALVRY